MVDGLAADGIDDLGDDLGDGLVVEGFSDMGTVSSTAVEDDEIHPLRRLRMWTSGTAGNRGPASAPVSEPAEVTVR